MTLKAGVGILGIRAELLLALVVADGVYRSRGSEMVVTSVTDGKHGRGSLHYKGLAADLRTSNIPQERRDALAAELRNALGPQFDVVLEVDHIHVEFDPKE